MKYGNQARSRHFPIYMVLKFLNQFQLSICFQEKRFAAKFSEDSNLVFL